jgi:hypothetical protein
LTDENRFLATLRVVAQSPCFLKLEQQTAKSPGKIKLGFHFVKATRFGLGLLKSKAYAE